MRQGAEGLRGGAKEVRIVGWWIMEEQNHEDHEHEGLPGCKCGGVCKIAGACGKHELKGEVKLGPENEKEVEARAED